MCFLPNHLDTLSQKLTKCIIIQWPSKEVTYDSDNIMFSADIWMHQVKNWESKGSSSWTIDRKVMQALAGMYVCATMSKGGDVQSFSLLPHLKHFFVMR